jgi:hypothetical protein
MGFPMGHLQETGDSPEEIIYLRGPDGTTAYRAQEADIISKRA